MRKKIIYILSCLLTQVMFTYTPLSVSANQEELVAKNQQETDINVIKDRLKETFLSLDSIDDGAKVETTYVSKAKEYLDAIASDGSWSDIDYKATDNAANGKAWSPYLALDRMQSMAIAYNDKDNELYQNQQVVEALNKALMHWKQEAPHSTNWWENDIGVNLRFSRIGLFLEDELSEDALSVIVSSLNEEGRFHGTGQNNLWYDQNAIYRALINENAIQLKKVLDECLSYVLVLQTDNTTQEALQVDNSLYFHGVQFYSNGYGLSMFRDMSFWLYHLRDTTFALDESVVERMSDYMLEGTKWTIRTDIAELYLGYRPYKYDVGYDNYAKEYVEPLKRMLIVDGKRSHAYQTLLDNIEGDRTDNGLSGNKYMWRVGYASHMRNGYGVNIKMDSKRIIGGEWRGSWPKENYGNLIYWSSSAASSFIVDGDEYTSIYPTYDWTHVPGTTTPSILHKGYANYGRFNNGSDHTIGVSNGKYGSTSYEMSKSNTNAKKSYFFFDEEIVALGSGITSISDHEIHTTLNQAKSENVEVNGKKISLGTQETYDVNTIYNDKVGYIFPKENRIVVKNGTQQEMPSLWSQDKKNEAVDAFSAYINHGKKPSNDTYEYIVVPNKTSSEVEAYAQNNAIEIIENNEKVQAVTHKELKITQFNFYEATSLAYAKGKTVSVDKPANVIIDESGESAVISLAMTDTDYNERVNVTLHKEGEETKTTFFMNQAPYTGQTITLSEGETNEIIASSAVDNHDIKFAFDNQQGTFWKSDKGEEQWIQKNLGKSTFVSNVSITWKENNAKKFKLQGSNDGVNFFDVSEELDASQSSVIPIHSIMSYFKIVLIESNKNQGYEISGVNIESGSNLALGKRVEVSSTSATDTANIASFATDGNSTTRWSSARKSNEEWLCVDLGVYSKIDAIKVKWEAARSDKYAIDISEDNLHWTRVKTIENMDGLEDTINFTDGIHGRYVRINSKKSKQEKYGISIFEVEIYGNTNESEPKNIALNKPSIASSEYKNPHSGFTLQSKYAFDGSFENNGDAYQSRWVSKRESKEEWIYVDLEDLYKIDSIVLNWEGACAKMYQMQVSNDALTWQNIYIVNDGKPGIKEILLDDEVEARYVRMLGIEPATKYGYSLWEFEVYGSLVEKEEVDKSHLEKTIVDANQLDKMIYTAASWKHYKQVLQQAENVLYNDAVKQNEVDAINQKLRQAISDLSELIRGLKDAYILEKGESINLDPLPKNGVWQYDAKYLWMSSMQRSMGGKVCFTALQIGETRIAYTTQKKEIKIVNIIIEENKKPSINESQTPSDIEQEVAPNTSVQRHTKIYNYGLLVTAGIIVVFLKRKKS
ncbi:MAG: discoidin domain-containing protein [Breznakia sp.]